MTKNNWPDSLQAPKLSVVVTCFNYERFVEQAILSVYAQDYKNIECIIVDDASTDGSAKVVRRVLGTLNDSRFNFVCLPNNLGQTRAMAEGLEKVTGQFVAFLDADDFLTADFASSHIAAHLNSTRTAGMSCCDMTSITESGAIVGNTVMTLAKPRNNKLIANREIAPMQLSPEWQSGAQGRQQLANECYHFEQTFPSHWYFAPTSSTVYRTDLVRIFLVPKDAERMKNADYFLSLLCSSFAGYIVIDKVCAFYRLHGQNIMSRNKYTGGQHWMSGPWNHADRVRMAKPMVREVVQNYRVLKNIYGHWFILLNLVKLGWPVPMRTVWYAVWLSFKHLLFEDWSPKQG